MPSKEVQHVVQQLVFPALNARDLMGERRHLPEAFEGRRNVVFIAFRREQQADIDSWAPWLSVVATPAGIAHYEVPVIGRRWAPLRPMIDGGMAVAIRDPEVLRRTLTVYDDVSRVTAPLGITDRQTVYAFLVSRGGLVLDMVSGPYDEVKGERLLRSALDGRDR